MNNKHLASNPADGISLDVRSKQGEKKRSFTDDEAKIILKAALAETDPVRRWVPWLGAYSGARVSELCQLRSEDIIKLDDIWCMKLDPEAGSLKTSGSERIIPLHPALVDRGFLKFASTIKAGPLFAALSPDKFGKRGGNGTKTIGRFVRQLGLKDTHLCFHHIATGLKSLFGTRISSDRAMQFSCIDNDILCLTLRCLFELGVKHMLEMID